MSTIQVGDLVTVIAAVDADIYDVSPFIGRPARVRHLDAVSGIGNTESDPLIHCVFATRETEAFFCEELAARKGSG